MPTHDLNRCDFRTYISSIIFHLNNHDLKITMVQFNYNQINQPAMQAWWLSTESHITPVLNFMIRAYYIFLRLACILLE